MNDTSRPVVCITGAGRGLGAALARRFARGGVDVVLAAQSAPEIDQLAEELTAEGVATLAVQTDVRVANECDRLIDATVAEFSRIDVMINNAGVAAYGPAEDVTPAEIDRMIDTNLKGAIYGSLAAYRVMKQQRNGRIINISSIAGKKLLPNESVYCASKWGLQGFSGTLQMEATRWGVHVTTICPGGINTPFWRTMDRYPFPDHIDPERDFLSPEEVAERVWEAATTSGRHMVPEVVILPLIPDPSSAR